MQIIQILKQDHSRLRKEIQELLDMEVGHEVVEKAREFSLLLKSHQRIEEEALYPPLEKVKVTRDKTLEGIEEHHVLDHLIAELQHLNPKDKMWKAKLTVIQEDLEHHLNEEEVDLFPKIATSLDKETLKDVLEQILEMKASAKI